MRRKSASTINRSRSTSSWLAGGTFGFGELESAKACSEAVDSLSGHSKWAGIKHKKAIVDAKRGQAFTRASREITIAAKEGGGDIEGNFRLRLAVQKAREANMPTDKIQAAIDRGTGAGKGESLEELRYEGYGPAGVAIMVDAVTDNRDRTAPAIRHVFSKHGASLGETNSVAWMFERKGVISAQAADKDPEEVGLVAIEAGADD